MYIVGWEAKINILNVDLNAHDTKSGHASGTFRALNSARD